MSLACGEHTLLGVAAGPVTAEVPGQPPLGQVGIVVVTVCDLLAALLHCVALPLVLLGVAVAVMLSHTHTHTHSGDDNAVHTHTHTHTHTQQGMLQKLGKFHISTKTHKLCAGCWARDDHTHTQHTHALHLGQEMITQKWFLKVEKRLFF